MSLKRPVFFFAGIWAKWTGTRGTKVKNDDVAPVHSKAMLVILTELEEFEIWMPRPIGEALTLQRPLPKERLMIIRHGEEKEDA